jgi:magnesium transporter
MGQTIDPITLSLDQAFPENPVWIDVQAPSEPELERIAVFLDIQLPDKKTVWKNHVLNRLYIEGDFAFMTAALINKVDSPYPATSPVTFILGSQFLLTIHENDPTSFKNFSVRLFKTASCFPTPLYILEGLLEEVITRVAYNSEIIVDTLDELSHDIFRSTDAYELRAETAARVIKFNQSSTILQSVLKRLGAAADLNSKINESLHSLNRLMLFIREEISNDQKIDLKIDLLQADIQALQTQTSFLSDKITFQLDATLGMINVEQNLIIKIFSMAAVFFLPPTLISSMYGMNFKYMPELDWQIGYPISLCLMILSAILPFLYFRRRGWL